MKSRFPLVFLWVLFCLASFAVIDCSKNEEKNLASGYTEENNAWNGLDSTLAKLLETWDSEVASDSVERRGTGEAEGKSWYEVEFMTEGEVVYVKEDDSSKAVVVLSVYERENGLQLKMETDSKTYNYTQMLERDSIFAVAVDRMDNSYVGDGVVEHCRADSLEFVQECSGSSGVFTDQYMLEKCTELHLVCRKSFEVSMSAEEYLATTVKKLKDRYSTEQTVVSNTLVDSRDGKVYRTIEIGGLTWMAENLNYAYKQPTALWDSSSFCYNDDPAYCDKYGRLYTWSAAMDSAGLFSGSRNDCGFSTYCLAGRNVRGVCPEGWRLPNYDEWTALIEAAGGLNVAARNLKAVEEGGSDSLGFSLLIPGQHLEYQRESDTAKGYANIGVSVNYWTTSEYSNNEAWGYYFFRDYDYVGESWRSKYFSMPVRCVKGEPSKLAPGEVDPESVEVGTLTDPRDGIVYKTVKIGEQVWMAENLRYAVDGESVCYENNEEYCAEFGRMYKGANPADSTADGTLQSYCPEGWRLPKRSEVDTLKVRTGSSFTTIKSASGWGESIGNGSDIYGFNILPGGSSYVRDDSLWFHDIGEDAIFWTSTYPTTYLVEAPEPYVFVIQAGDGSRIIDPRYYLYIRCIKE